MKRKITFLLSALFALTMITQPLNMVGQNRDSAGFTLTSSAGSSTSGSITGTASETWSWTATFSNGATGSTQNSSWQIGSSSKPCTQVVFSTSIGGTITAISVSCGTKNKAGIVNCTVGGSDFGDQGQSTGTGNNPSSYGTTPSFTGSASGAIEITITNGGQTYISVKSITVTYSVGSTKTITFDGNGGTYSETTIYTQTVPESTATALTANKFTYEGYAFLGWSTVRDGDVVYSDKASITTSVDVTLYAKWRPLTIYTLVTTNDSLVPGKHYIIASSKTVGESRYIMDAQNSTKYRELHEVTIKSKIVDAKTVKYIEEFTGIYEFVLSGDNTNGWTIYDNRQDTKKYLYANGGTSNNYISITDNISTTGAKWSINITASQNAEIIANNTDDDARNTLRYNGGSTRFSCYSTGQSPVYLFVKDGDTQIEFHSNTNIGTNVSVGQNLTLTNAITIEDDGILDMGNNTLSIGSGGSITIEDGGQLIANSVLATVKKTIADPLTKDEDYGHWYTISTPVHKGSTDNVVISETNLTSGPSKYDMFYFDETEGIWMNQKETHEDPEDPTSTLLSAGFSNMYVGKGYLYRNDGTDLEITGNTNTGNEITYTLTKTGSSAVSGFNLLGNPYPHDINLKHITYNTPYAPAGFYRLTNAAGWSAEMDGDDEDPIHSYEGFLLQANDNNIKATFHETEQPAAKSNKDNIKFIVANSQYEDAAYALFDKGFGLTKIDHRNANIPMLYINHDGENFAIATMSDDTRTFNLNFKAMTTGKYTLSYKANGQFNYLHIIDRLTGEDVDMLLDGQYSFIASPNDSDARFIVKLNYDGGNAISENEIFAFQNGNDIYVTGNGELQIFDVTGRRVMNTTINGAESISIPAQGVYIFRLNEKVQKIVVR